MDWVQFALFSIGALGLFLWNRSESRADSREQTAAIMETRNEAIDLRIDMNNAIRSIDKEMKDFHGRLCAIEERRLKDKNL